MSEQQSATVRLPENKQPALRVMPMPSDVNPSGDVFGGWIMAMVDMAGSIPARRRAKRRVATIAVNSFLFKQPVSVGDLVSIYAEVASVGRTSVSINVEVYAERDPENPVVVKVTEATLTYVALDDMGRKQAIPRE
jgi:acyl-CoA thioesterase YciA